MLFIIPSKQNKVLKQKIISKFIVESKSIKLFNNLSLSFIISLNSLKVVFTPQLHSALLVSLSYPANKQLFSHKPK